MRGALKTKAVINTKKRGNDTPGRRNQRRYADDPVIYKINGG